MTVLSDVVAIRSATPRRRLVSQAAGNAGLNAASTVFNFAIALLLSRLLGAEGYGAYAFALAWAMLLGVPAVLGLPSVVVRELAKYRVRDDWSGARGLIRRANHAVLAASGAIALSAAVCFLTLDWPEPQLRAPTLIGMLLVPLLAVISIRQCAMQGFGAVVLGRAPEALAAPGLTIVLVLALEASLARGLSANWAVTAHVAAASATAVLGIYLLRRTLPDAVRAAQPRNETRAWLVAAAPLLLMGGIQTVNGQAGTILTGAIAGSGEAGVFGVGVRVAGLLPFLLLAAVPPLMPRIAELHAQGARESLQRLLTRASRMVFLGSLPIAFGAIVFAEPLLGLFGEDFGAGVTPLRVLALGQLVNVATGFAGMTLIMIGEPAQLIKAVSAGTAVNLAIGAALIPRLGAEGAALATASSVALTNILAVYLLWRRTGIYSPPFGLGFVSLDVKDAEADRA